MAKNIVCKIGEFYELYSLGSKLPDGPYQFLRKQGSDLTFTKIVDSVETLAHYSENELDDATKYTPKKLQRIIADQKARAYWIEKNLQLSSPVPSVRDAEEGSRLFQKRVNEQTLGP